MGGGGGWGDGEGEINVGPPSHFVSTLQQFYIASHSNMFHNTVP